jgi:hypothetical protein
MISGFEFLPLNNAIIFAVGKFLVKLAYPTGELHCQQSRT